MSVKEKSLGVEPRQFWPRAMEARRKSGLSIAAFCLQEGLSEAAYYYWRRKLAGGMPKSKEKSSPDFLEVIRSGRRG